MFYIIKLKYKHFLKNAVVEINIRHLTFKNFVAPFYGWGWTASKLQSPYEDTGYFLPLGEWLKKSFSILGKIW